VQRRVIPCVLGKRRSTLHIPAFISGRKLLTVIEKTSFHITRIDATFEPLNP
jgi:hypothetical protein